MYPCTTMESGRRPHRGRRWMQEKNENKSYIIFPRKKEEAAKSPVIFPSASKKPIPCWMNDLIRQMEVGFELLAGRPSFL